MRADLPATPTHGISGGRDGTGFCMETSLFRASFAFAASPYQGERVR